MNQKADKLVDIQEVSSLTGISRSQIYNLVSSDLFPTPLDLSTGKNRRCTRWSFNEIQDWIEGKKLQREAS